MESQHQAFHSSLEISQKTRDFHIPTAPAAIVFKENRRLKIAKPETVYTKIFTPPFGDSIIATAILDRLLHHSTTINIRGESYRLKDRRKAGLVPARGQDGVAATSLASDSLTPKTRQKTAQGSTPSEAKEAHQ